MEYTNIIVRRAGLFESFELHEEMTATMNQRAKDGWRVISVIYNSNSHEAIVTFERPVT